jgi:hypothetical protein
MWLLSFIPDAWIALAVHIIFGLGIIGIIVGTVLNHIPFVNSYGKIIRAVSIVLFVSGLYFEGGIGVEKEWRAKVAELEAKIKVVETQSKQANKKIHTKVIEKIKIVKVNVANNKQAINKHKEAIDAECKLNAKAIEVYNNAIKNGAK